MRDWEDGIFILLEKSEKGEAHCSGLVSSLICWPMFSGVGTRPGASYKEACMTVG